MTNWISDLFTSDFGWNHLERLVDLPPRMAGWRGEKLAAEATREALREAGCHDVELREFPIPKWERGSSTLETPYGKEDCIALPYSPSRTVSGELVDIGTGTPEEFESVDLDGIIAMASSTVHHEYPRFVHRREKYHRAVNAGAEGFVYANHVPGCMAPTGKIGCGEGGEIPALGVSREVGARLGRRCDGEEVELAVEAETGGKGEATSRNVVGWLGGDGDGDTEEKVLVTSHVDAHDISEGAADNGMGTAMVVEVANALSEREDHLDCRIEFVPFGAEEVGLRGSRRYVEECGLEDVKAVVNLDGVGRTRDLKVYNNGFREFDEAIDAVSGKLGHEIEIVDAVDPHSDHWPFVERGLPALYVKSETDGRDRGWGHTAADTLDKLDVRDLRHQSIVVAEMVREVASEEFEVEPTSIESIKSMLESQGEDKAMKVTGEWNYGSSGWIPGDG
ncbi:MAG: M28 family peptidase [Halobacteria archaeon]